MRLSASDSPVWWIKYSRHGRPYRGKRKTTNVRKAETMLKNRLAEIATGTFLGPQAERVRVEELADDFIRDYRINGRKSLEDVTTRWEHHLKPFFGVLRAIEVTSDLIARYVDATAPGGKCNHQSGVGSIETNVSARPQVTPRKFNGCPHSHTCLRTTSARDFSMTRNIARWWTAQSFGSAHWLSAGAPMDGVSQDARSWSKLTSHSEIIRLEPGTTDC